MQKRRIIVALDKSTAEENMRVVSKLPKDIWVKVGPVLFNQCPGILTELKNSDRNVMWDMKYHDIPNTVRLACQAAAYAGVKMITVHLSGGREMVAAAVVGAEEGNDRRLNEIVAENGPVDVSDGFFTKILGISVLTSHDPQSLEAVGFRATKPSNPTECFEGHDMIKYHVSELVRQGVQCDVHGIVCSAMETEEIRKIYPNLIIVNPGVRVPSAEDESHDQKRITSPKEAFDNGASFVVMGRQVINHSDPKAFLAEVTNSINA